MCSSAFIFVYSLLICYCLAKTVTSPKVACWSVGTNIHNATTSNSTGGVIAIGGTYEKYFLFTYNASYKISGYGPVTSGTNYSLSNYLNDAVGRLYLNASSSIDYPFQPFPLESTTTSRTFVLSPCDSQGITGIYETEYYDDTYVGPGTTLGITTITRHYATQLFVSCAPLELYVNFSPFYLTIDFTAENITKRVYLNFTSPDGTTNGVPFTSYCFARNSCDASGQCVKQGLLNAESGYNITADLEPGLYYVILNVTETGGDYVLAASSGPIPQPEPTSTPTPGPTHEKSWIEENFIYIIITGVGVAVILIVLVIVVIVRRRRAPYQRV